MKRIKFRKTKRKTVAENIAYRVACNQIRARLAVLTPDRERAALAAQGQA
jgi:hypothetical protein